MGSGKFHIRSSSYPRGSHSGSSSMLPFNDDWEVCDFLGAMAWKFLLLSCRSLDLACIIPPLFRPLCPIDVVRQSFFLPNLVLRLTLSGLDPRIFRGAQRAFFLEQPSSGNAGISGVFPRGYGGRKTKEKQKTTERLHAELRDTKIDSVKGLDIDSSKDCICHISTRD